MHVVPVRLEASESLINGHITALQCEPSELSLPSICDCDGETNGCGERQRFRASQAAMFDAPAALSCYVNTSRSANQSLYFYWFDSHVKRFTMN